MQEIPFTPPKSIWQKAAVVGSLWASVEIIVGSFLHNLSIPFSGTILSFAGIYLLVSFFQVWKENGLIWRAGLICALMKSISPSAVILGPMIGILSEALLLELSVFLLGKNLAGYITGGGLAVLSTLIQKVVNLLIMYGFNFISILDALYRFCIKQLNITLISPVYLILGVASLYFMAGALAAILGKRSGSNYLKNRHSIHSPPEISLQLQEPLFSQSTVQHYSFLYLALNVCAMILCLFLLNVDLILLSVLCSSAYAGFCIFQYRNSFRRFKKISIWIQFILITLAAAFLWNGISNHNFFSIDGLIVGLKMIFRAIIIIMGFAAISIELKNPLIKSLLSKKGFANVYPSLGLAFSALPGIIASLPKSKENLKKSNFSFSTVLKQAETLLQQFEKDHTKRPSILIITGEIGQGKTTYTQNLVKLFQEKGYRVGGFLAIGIHENDKRTGFDLLDIRNSRQFELCRDTPHKNRIKSGNYYFNRAALADGNELIALNNLEEMQLVVIDEVGPMEMKNQGWAESITRLCQSGWLTQLWVVRKSLVEKATRKWNTGNVFVFDITKDPVESVIHKYEEILNELEINRLS
ncbi:MAG: nucleoside-triphosphatase [Bacteroidales bacterium]|jgi:nucleoside-triphosphatase THEP1